MSTLDKIIWMCHGNNFRTDLVNRLPNKQLWSIDAKQRLITLSRQIDNHPCPGDLIDALEWDLQNL